MTAPNPGSAEAVLLGCICPIGDNGRGRGAFEIDGVWCHWVTAGCPLHDETPTTEEPDA